MKQSYSMETMINGRSAEQLVTQNIMMCSLVVVAAVCYAQVSGSRVILLFGLASFFAVTLWASYAGKALNVLLFFLPWSPLIKVSRHSYALFTFALLMICAICLVRNGFNIKKYQIIIPAVIVIETLFSKLIQGNSISNAYLFFMIMLVLFPCIMDETITDIFSFYDITAFFATGIISAALTAQRIAVYPNISAFITVDSYQMITRLSGFYGDPNFYAAQITACFAGVQILLIHEKIRNRRIILSVIALLLFYCGMLSASKTFVIVFAFLMLLWTILILDKENRGSTFFRIFFGVAIAVVLVLSSSEFTRLFQIVTERFSFSSSASEITTHRTDLWLMYLGEFSRNPLLTLFGEGYTNINLNDRASHNTVIQGVFQLGITGLSLLLTWMSMSMNKLINNNIGMRLHGKYVILIVAGAFLPWLSLDMLFFDEFFLMPFYACCAIIYSSNVKEAGA